MNDRSIVVITVIVFIVVGIFYLWRDYGDLVVKLTHPNKTAANSIYPTPPTIQIYKNPFK